MTGRPADWVAAACADLGTEVVVGWCVGLLAGQAPDDGPSLDHLGGPGAADLVAGYARTPGKPDYWPRVWAARALRYAWLDGPEVHGAVVAALADPAWRVRETAAALTRVHELGEASAGLRLLLSDEVPRVRAAAAEALAVVGEHDDLDALAAVHEPDPGVRRAVDRARRLLAERLDLPDPGARGA
ncbi:HEAT repeat domain-containing protein [Cellulomonas sp. ICMP 17802]|uniref:HEAT repeat domain-containing protein n=1 Tax=Cellulomonas sp. ICMP 17802 TaxID=3239199 RepID=UPI00351BC649